MNARTLGNRYEVGRLLGYGGMAEVHLARDTRLDRDVAIKILRSDLARDHTFQVRFRREAQSAASLNHPAIVSVYDTGSDPTTDPATPYIVMEYVEGQTLRDLLHHEGVLEPPQAMRIVAEMCGALDFSHRNGIVHRDVKPGNVMITPAGRVKVMDFGIARAVADTAATMTATAAVVGTAQYLSPEQARGESVDARSDVYAVGCVLYELLTGKPPFTGDSPVAVAYQHVRELPTVPSQINASVPPELDAIAMKALSKNPANRYQSAAEMQDDLDRAIMGERVHAAPVLSEEEATTVIPSIPPVPVASTAAGSEDDEPARKTGVSGRTWALLAGLVALIMVAAFLVVPALFGSDDPAPVETVAVPAVAGQTLEQATAALEDAGLEVGEVTTVTSSVDQKDTVMSTDPPNGESVEKGTAVNLSIGAGPNQVTVPDVVGMSQAEAEQALVALNLAVSVLDQDDSQPAGTVLSTSPAAGASVPESSSVTVFVSSGQITVPNVVGMTQSEAEQALSAVGLVGSFVEEESTATAGTVVKTEPAGGSPVSGSDQVQVLISTGQITIAVPNVIGMPEAQAITTLATAGFTSVNTVAQQSSEATPGTVIGQDPASGSLPPDTAITLRIATPPPPSPSPTATTPGTTTPSTPPPDTEDPED